MLSKTDENKKYKKIILKIKGASLKLVTVREILQYIFAVLDAIYHFHHSS